jgi:hypothetical protein
LQGKQGSSFNPIDFYAAVQYGFSLNRSANQAGSINDALRATGDIEVFKLIY